MAWRDWQRSAVAGIALAAFLGAMAGWRAFAARREGSARTAWSELGAYAPPDAEGVLVADLARLRASPHVGAWFARASAGASSCEAALARRVRSVLVVVPALPVEAFALAAAGDLEREALVRCASARGTGRPEVLRERVRIVAAGGRAEVVYLPRGVALAGDAALVRAMEDARGARPRDQLDALRERLGRTTVQAVWRRARDPEDGGPRRSVLGIAAGVDLDAGLEGEAVVLCASEPDARAVAAMLATRGPALARELESAGLRALAEGLEARAEGARVRVRFRLDGRRLDGLLAELDAWARARPRARPPPDPGGG